MNQSLRFKFICAYFILGITSVYAQPFSIGHVTVSFTDPSRDNRTINTEIYYPADSNGDNVPVAGSEAFPVAAFGHGFVMGVDAYENIWSMLVPQGFIVALPTTEGGILPNHENFGKDLAFVIEQMEFLGSAPSSLFSGKVSDQSVVMGHSMGGGASFLAMQYSSAIDAIATLAPANTNPSSIDAASGISKPALVFAGANDCVTPPPQHQLPMYSNLQSECKTYISITGGSHCQMADSNFLCNLGEITCSPDAEIAREEQHATIENYLVDWLKSTLKDDCDAGALFDERILTDGDITYQTNCVLCEPLQTGEFSTEIAVIPNPFRNELQFRIATVDSCEFVLYDLHGRVVLSQIVSDGSEVNTTFLPSGFYTYLLASADEVRTGKLVKY